MRLRNSALNWLVEIRMAGIRRSTGMKRAVVTDADATLFLGGSIEPQYARQFIFKTATTFADGMTSLGGEEF